MSEVIDRTNHVAERMEDFIRFYRSQRLNVIPIRYRDKTPIGEWKQYQSKVMSDEEIQKNFLSGAAVNIAIVCGTVSDNLVVIDFDSRSTYKKHFAWAEKDTFVVQTGKGVHVYFKTDYPVRGFKIQELTIDVKGEGGYVLAPPSIHPNGKEYKALSDLPIAHWSGDFKQELYERLKIKREPEEVDINKLLDGVEEGERDEAAIRVATWYRTQGFTEEQTARTLKEWNEKNRPPLDEPQLLKCVKSAFKPKEPYAYNFRATEVKQELTPEIESFLKDPHLHNNIEAILGFRIVGETNLKALYFYAAIGAAVSKTPFGVIAVDVLGTGKSYGEREVLRAFPTERVDQPTSLTSKVVNYLGGNFSGRIVRIDELYKKASEEKEEEEGLPYIRMWMTEGRLEHWTSNPETRKEERITSEGCPFFLTSTTYEVGEQIGSRNWIVHIDTSIEQTRRIHEYQRMRHSLPETVFKHEEEQLKFLAQVTRWLMQNAKKVLIPFRFSFPSTEPRNRRELEKLLQLIRCVANVHQLHRKHVAIDGTEYIIAEIQDFEIALAVCRDFLRSSIATLDKYSLQILAAMITEPVRQWKVKEIWETTQMKSESTIRRKLKVLSSQGYVSSEKEEGSRNTYVYQLTLRGVELQKDLDIRIIDDGAWMLPLYDRLSKGEDPQVVRQEIESRLSKLSNFSNISPLSDLEENSAEKSPDLQSPENHEKLKTSPTPTKMESWIVEATRKKRSDMSNGKPESTIENQGGI